MNKQVYAYIKYTDGSFAVKGFGSKKLAEWFVHLEGDHVLDYEIRYWDEWGWYD